MKDFIIQNLKNISTEELKRELLLKKEWLEEEPYLAKDEEFCAGIKAIEDELASRGVAC
jgi:hypothetical protein